MVEIDLTKLNGKENITKLFARILKENRIFVSYIKNLKMQKIKTTAYKEYMKFGFGNNYVAEIVGRITSHNNLASIANVLRTSFIWSNTPEGHYFWMNLCDCLSSKKYLPKKTNYIELKHLINISK